MEAASSHNDIVRFVLPGWGCGCWPLPPPLLACCLWQPSRPLRSALRTCGGGIMSRVLVSTCRFLSRQRLCCQLGYFFFLFFFFPFSFPLPASILEWFPAGAGTQPSLETSSWADLCKLPQMSVPGFSCHPRRVCGRDASSSAWQWAAACGRTRLSPDPCCPHRCSGYAGVAKT